MQGNNQLVVPKLELIKNSRKFKMVIPSYVEERIRLACASVPNLEWSGVLFFKYKGNFEDGNLQVVCKDILLMDVGSAAYTEWAADAEVISYMAENDLLDCQMGIIHSHNTMATFFSGTDTGTLLQEGQDRNNIVSLIVNNDGTYSAAVTRHVFTEAKVHEKGTYQLFGDGEQSYEEDYEIEDEYIEYFMFDIVRKEPNRLFSFIDRLKEVMTKKRTTVVASQPSSGYGYGGYGYGGYGGYHGPASPAQPKGTIVNPTVPASKSAAPSTPVKGAVSSGSPKPTTAAPSGKFNQFNPVEPAVKDDFETYIEGLALQIVTGNVFADVEGVMDLKVFCKDAMVDMYKKRFGDDVSSKSSFASWVDNLIDFLVWDADHPELDGFSFSDKGELVAKELVTLLEAIPTKNIYLNLIIDRLKSYV